MIAWVLVPPDAWPRWSRGLGAGGQCSPSGPAGPVSPRRAVDGQQYLQHQLSSSLPAANHFHLLLQSLGHTTPGLQQAHQLFPVHPVLRLRLLQQPRCILQRRRGCRFLRGCENRAREPGDGLATFKETDRLAVLDLMRQQQPGAAGRDWDLAAPTCRQLPALHQPILRLLPALATLLHSPTRSIAGGAVPGPAPRAISRCGYELTKPVLRHT
mmetsp:Transcript_90773/g.207746  ORF Transcript_90773/g.207746 Transcript_90773/m.207746 type:complete len:213 (+) Transcript_90773:166-804(+)